MTPSVFARWWAYRNLPNDRKIVREVIAAGLVQKAGDLLFLTDAGKRLRAAACQ